jgi:NAD(P)-dependent dehydrogenase (short-subunit alcohol dehydrogenase family)
MKTWFITGTSTGFGRELTEQLLARGDRVATALRTPETLDELAAANPDKLWVRRLDVTDAAASSTPPSPTSAASRSSSPTPATASSARPRS